MSWLSAFSTLARLFGSLAVSIVIGGYARREELGKPVYRPSRRPRDVLSGGSRSKLKLLALETMMSVSGCANIDAPVVAGCEWVRPIILAEDDRLTTETIRALLAHNEAVAVFCGSIR